MALNPLNSSSLEQLALKGLRQRHGYSMQLFLLLITAISVSHHFDYSL